METSIKVETKTFTQRIRIEGYADPRNKKADIRVFNRDSGTIKMPYIEERFGLKSNFDSTCILADAIDTPLSLSGWSFLTLVTKSSPKAIHESKATAKPIQASSNVSITGGAISNVSIADVTIDCGTY